MKDYSKLSRFTEETFTHFQLRMLAYRWLWQHGFRAFASYVNLEPYGLIDVVGIKESEIAIIDIVETHKEIYERSKDVGDLNQQKRILVNAIVERISTQIDIDLTNDIIIQSNMKVLTEINSRIQQESLYWRMLNTVIVANKHYTLFLTEHEPTRKLKGWGYIRCHYSEKAGDYKPYTIQEAEPLQTSILINRHTIESSMLRAVSNEIMNTIPENIFTAM